MELKNNFTNSLHMHDLLLLGVELCRGFGGGLCGAGKLRVKGYALRDHLKNIAYLVIRLVKNYVTRHPIGSFLNFSYGN